MKDVQKAFKKSTYGSLKPGCCKISRSLGWILSDRWTLDAISTYAPNFNFGIVPFGGKSFLMTDYPRFGRVASPIFAELHFPCISTHVFSIFLNRGRTQQGCARRPLQSGVLKLSASDGYVFGIFSDN